MYRKELISSNSLETAGPTKFTNVVKRLKEEHSSLEEKLNHLYIKAEQAQGNRDMSVTLNLLLLLRVDVKNLMKELGAHEEWEELQVYPIASAYFKQRIRPSITPSIWVLEKEHEIVKQCFQPFLLLSKEIIATVENNQAKVFKQLNLCLVYLLQGCSVLQEHIELEEGLIYPLVDEIIAAIGHKEISI
ncbi:hemerythrin domain-containing protein [Paenibacillus psychroresistens]|nr:hemerythrin domain-containing protein [Paenibacillus psychroresistens]